MNTGAAKENTPTRKPQFLRNALIFSHRISLLCSIHNCPLRAVLFASDVSPCPCPKGLLKDQNAVLVMVLVLDDAVLVLVLVLERKSLVMSL